MPLVADPNYADEFLFVDVHNTCGRCDNGPSGPLKNRYGYPTNSVHLGLAKIRLAVMDLTRVRTHRVCIMLSADENSSVRRAHYPEYKMNRVRQPGEPFIIAGKRLLKYKDGYEAWFDYETDDMSMLSHPDLVSSGFRRIEEAVYKVHDSVRDFMEAMSCIPSCVMTIVNNDGETDDALATGVHLARPRPCYVLTEDRDIWATMSDRVRLISKPGVEYTIESLHNRFGIEEPAKLPLAKALYGDDSDNVSKPVANVTDKSVGALLRRCVRQPGDDCYTQGFMREVESALQEAKGRNAQTFTNLLAAAAEVRRLELIMRLRRVDLAYTHNTRDVARLEQLLAWYGIKNTEKTLAFAQM